MIRLFIMVIIGLISVSSSAYAESQMAAEKMSAAERPIARFCKVKIAKSPKSHFS